MSAPLEEARALLYRRDGLVAVCRACGRAREGTATFACEHQRDCWGAQLFAVVVRAAAHTLVS